MRREALDQVQNLVRTALHMPPGFYMQDVNNGFLWSSRRNHEIIHGTTQIKPISQPGKKNRHGHRNLRRQAAFIAPRSS